MNGMQTEDRMTCFVDFFDARPCNAATSAAAPCNSGQIGEAAGIGAPFQRRRLEITSHANPRKDKVMCSSEYSKEWEWECKKNQPYLADLIFDLFVDEAQSRNCGPELLQSLAATIAEAGCAARLMEVADRWWGGEVSEEDIRQAREFDRQFVEEVLPRLAIAPHLLLQFIRLFDKGRIIHGGGCPG